MVIGLFRSAGEKKFEKRTLKISADEVTIHVNRDNSLVLDLPVASTQVRNAVHFVPMFAFLLVKQVGVTPVRSNATT